MIELLLFFGVGVILLTLVVLDGARKASGSEAPHQHGVLDVNPGSPPQVAEPPAPLCWCGAPTYPYGTTRRCLNHHEMRSHA